MLTISQVKVGQYLDIDGRAYEVLKADHTKPGKGHAILKLKVEDLENGNVLEKTFQGNDKFDEAEISDSKAQFLYYDNLGYHFMDQTTFEQFSLPKDKLQEKAKYLIEGTEVEIINLNGQPINISLPIKMTMKVKSAPPGIKGNTADGGTKEVITENGLQVMVPLFIKEGDNIRVKTTDGTYVERA